MSNKDFAKALVDQMPKSKSTYAIAYLQGAAIPEEIPNTETLESIQELESGNGISFSGNTEDLFYELRKD